MFCHTITNQDLRHNPSTCTAVEDHMSDNMQSDKRPCAWWQEETVLTLLDTLCTHVILEIKRLFTCSSPLNHTVVQFLHVILANWKSRPTLSSHHERSTVAVNIISKHGVLTHREISHLDHVSFIAVVMFTDTTAMETNSWISYQNLRLIFSMIEVRDFSMCESALYWKVCTCGTLHR